MGIIPSLYDVALNKVKRILFHPQIEARASDQMELKILYNFCLNSEARWCKVPHMPTTSKEKVTSQKAYHLGFSLIYNSSFIFALCVLEQSLYFSKFMRNLVKTMYNFKQKKVTSLVLMTDDSKFLSEKLADKSFFIDKKLTA